MGGLCAPFEKLHFVTENLLTLHVGHILMEIGLLFSLTSGRTGQEDYVRKGR